MFYETWDLRIVDMYLESDLRSVALDLADTGLDRSLTAVLQN